MLADNIVNVINLETKSIGMCPLSLDRVFTFSPELYNYIMPKLQSASSSVGPRSYYCSEQGPDAGGQSHGQRTPERDTYCAHRHIRAARARRQRTQKREEQQ
jgi:hypothetical protein